MKYRKLLAVLGIVGVVAVVGVAGTALAQTPTPTPNQQTKTNYQNFFLDRVAQLLNVPRSQLDSALGQAKNDTIDQAAKDGKITQDQANKLKSQPNNRGFGFGFGFGGGRGPKGMMGMPGGSDVVNAVAKALNMQPQDMVNQLRSGKTLEDLVTAQGKQDSDVKTAIVNTVKPRLDQMVQNKRITQDQEDKIISQIQSADLSKYSFGRGFRMPGGKPGQNQAPGTKPSMQFRVPPRGAA